MKFFVTIASTLFISFTLHANTFSTSLPTGSVITVKTNSVFRGSVQSMSFVSSYKPDFKQQLRNKSHWLGQSENYYADGRNAGCDIFDVSGKDASAPRSLEAGRKFLVERVEEFQYEDLEHTTVSTSQWDNSSDANYILSEILSDGSKIKSPIQIRCYARQMCIARSKMISPREPVYRWGQCNNVSFKSSDIVDILGSTFEIAFGKIPSL